MVLDIVSVCVTLSSCFGLSCHKEDNLLTTPPPYVLIGERFPTQSRNKLSRQAGRQAGRLLQKKLKKERKTRNKFSAVGDSSDRSILNSSFLIHHHDNQQEISNSDSHISFHLTVLSSSVPIDIVG